MRLKLAQTTCVLLAVPLIMTLSTGWSAKQLQTDSIHLRGSGNVAAFTQYVAERYMQDNPSSTVTVENVGTMRGIKSLINATSNIAMASSDSDPEQEKHAKDNNIMLVKHVIAHDALIPAIHQGNGITNLTIEQLRKIFSGEITNWQQLGGPNLPVVVTSYDGSTGNYETWKDKVMGEGKVVSPAAKIMTADNMKTFISQTPGAIGYLALANLDNTVKTLNVEGVRADMGTIKSNTYPITRDLVLYTAKDATGPVNKFIEYFLSDKGQQFVREAGVLPVK